LHIGTPLVYAPRMHTIAALYDVPDTPSTLMRPLVLSLVGGVYELAQADVDRVLASVEVGEVWGVRPRLAAWLEAQGTTTALGLKRAGPKAIRSVWRGGLVIGEEVRHADQKPLACGHMCRTGLVGGQLSATHSFLSVRHRAWAARQGAASPQPHAVAGAAPQTKCEAAARPLTGWWAEKGLRGRPGRSSMVRRDISPTMPPPSWYHLPPFSGMIQTTFRLIGGVMRRLTTRGRCVLGFRMPWGLSGAMIETRSCTMRCPCCCGVQKCMLTGQG
jgi:hypothetical protein